MKINKFRNLKKIIFFIFLFLLSNGSIHSYGGIQKIIKNFSFVNFIPPLSVRIVISLIYSIVSVGLVLFLIYFLLKKSLLLLINKIQKKSLNEGTNKTLILFIKNFIKIIKILLIVFFALYSFKAFGVDLIPIICSLSVLVLPISIAAQNFIKNLFDGIIFLLRNYANVGDYVEAGSVFGKIESLNLKGLKIRQKNGAISFLQFSQIGLITNYSIDYSISLSKITLPIETDFSILYTIIDDVVKNLNNNESYGKKILTMKPNIKIDYVDQYGIHAIISLKIKSDPLNSFQTIFTEHILNELRKNNIKLGSNYL